SVSHDAVDDCTGLSAEPSGGRQGRVGRALPALLVSALCLCAAPRTFSARCPGPDARILYAPFGAPRAHACGPVKREIPVFPPGLISELSGQLVAANAQPEARRKESVYLIGLGRRRNPVPIGTGRLSDSRKDIRGALGDDIAPS